MLDRTLPRFSMCFGIFALLVGGCTSVVEQSRIVDPFDLSADTDNGNVFPEYRIVPGDVLQISFFIRAQEQAEYRIQISDEVEVKFLTLPEYDTQQIVRPDGRITLPFQGDVRIAGSTPAEATERIRSAYGGILRVPDVYLTLKQPNAGLATLNASVSTDDSDGRELVVRPDGKISLPTLGEIFAAGSTVEELSNQVNEHYRETYPHAQVDMVLVQSAGSTVSVFGEVGSPGAIPVTRPLMLFEAIALAGGDTVNSELSTVVAMRRDGEVVQARIIDLGALLSGDEDGVMPVVRPGDIVYVPRTPLTTAATIAAQVSAITAYQAIMQGAAITVINNAINP